MSRQFIWWIGFLPLSGILLLSACKEETGLVSEEEDASYKAAMGLKNGDSDRKTRALEEFLKVIERRKVAPKSHLEVGLLYLGGHVGDPDPISAIYHFKKFLEYIPDSSSEQGRRVRGQIERAERIFMASLPGDPYQTQSNGNNAMQLEELIKSLREENRKLRTKLDQLTNATQEFSLQDNLQDSPAAPRTRVYKVIQGDTLFKIASKVYGDPGRWREIYDANRQTLPRENALQPGQELLIP